MDRVGDNERGERDMRTFAEIVNINDHRKKIVLLAVLTFIAMC